jgi:hypothetical protein
MTRWKEYTDESAHQDGYGCFSIASDAEIAADFGLFLANYA